MSKIQRAILSVTDKTGLVEFARKLAGMGVELVSTGGTAQRLREAGIAVKDISGLTGFPEMLDGRVKTLHPKVHGGILHVRALPKHRQAVAEHDIPAIDMVVVSLYAFEKTAAQPEVQFQELIENIDIGGPAMIRSAAKNFQDVAILTSPADYDAVAEEMRENGGELTLATKWRLAQQAFATTAAYDAAIASTLERVSLSAPTGAEAGAAASSQPGGAAAAADFRLPPPGALPQTLRITGRKVMNLRYGENPHQKAAMYSSGSGAGIANGRQLQGKELSYNNIVDLQAAWDLAADFAEPFCAIIKHTNPCGSAIGHDPGEAFQKAFACDPVSAFGGVIALNRPIDSAIAEAIAGLRHNGAALFIECIVAPAFDEAARERFAKRKDLRLLEIDPAPQEWLLKAISGGWLLQEADRQTLDPRGLKVVSRRPPTAAEMRDLQFAWTVCKHVKSNAILYARNGQGIGVGAGQMSRVDAAKLGAMKAVLPLQGSVAASDAFFPFPDGVEEIAKAGATAVIQPGGSVRDEDVVAAADRLGLAMVLTGVRHFRH
jgi:phosphoribosylaminoimidazolecarboxamide formyltransferase/IMP cyclohydrolase